MMSTEKTSKRTTGGSAAERGLDFQARVSAIVMANLLTERPVGWLDGVLDDTPTELHAETGGPGDDIRFLVNGGKQVEVQAKRGLQRGNDLWTALMALSEGLSAGSIDAGVLAVCPNSSGTIREALAEDIVRLGTGRRDGLRDIGQVWAAQLSAASLDSTLVCKTLRIVVVSAIDGNREAEATAAERLSRIVRDQGGAWSVLVEYGRRLIRRRERSTPEDMCRTLSLANIALKTTEVETRAQLSEATRQWLHRTHTNMIVLGVRSAVPFDACWLEQDMHVLYDAPTEEEDLDKAIRRYHAYGHDRRHGNVSFDSHTAARFVRKCVIVGGPGMGKSTLLKKLALDYSTDGYLTLLVRLPQVIALLTREGHRFEDCLMEVALSGSGLRAPIVSLDGAVILCDALDECGSQQPLVTANLHAFSMAHPNTRFVVTSRPIGYRPGELTGWRHYELQPLDDTAAEKAVIKVLQAIPFGDAALRSRAIEQATAQLSAKTIKDATARSPLMVTLVAALSAQGIDPGLSKSALYLKLFQLLQDHPPTRLIESPPSEPERNRFLDMLGWCLLCHGNEPAEQTLSRCTQWWSERAGQSPFLCETKIGQCLGYWESLGVIERVRTHNQEAITFVHKTFGEFAAARYMSKCTLEAQRGIIARAISTPDWKEALSFASHLGLTSQILQVWTELAEGGDFKAGNRLDDAVELVIQAGVPLTSKALSSFVQCCWVAVDNTTSRVRYAAGEALCLVSQAHWGVIQEAALARLESHEGWNQLVAWACLCVSSDKELTIPVLVEALPRLVDSQPIESQLGGFSLRANGGAVWRHLVLGAARRILAKPPEPKALQALLELIGNADHLNLNSFWELQKIFSQADLDLSELLNKGRPQNRSWPMPDHERWNREAIYLLALIDDPLVASDDVGYHNPNRSLELGACMTAISYWEMPAGNSPSQTASASSDAIRRLLIHSLVRTAGIGHSQLVGQSRSWKKKIHDDARNEGIGLFYLPKVDAMVDLDQPLVDIELIPQLEDLIVGNCDLFALNAAHALYSLRRCPEYPVAIERLLTRGLGESLRISVPLASHLPEEMGQRLLLDRLLKGEGTPGCRYVYQSLKAPYGPRHLDAIRRGLAGNSALAAKAAAMLVKEFSLDAEMARELRVYFDQWRTKEEPYPKGGGTVPVSPRDELAKILAQGFKRDHDFLLALLADLRPEVQRAALEHALAEASDSANLRSRFLEEVQSYRLKPGLLRSAVSAGLYRGHEAIAVARLLYSEDASFRYAALPILDVKYLHPEQVRDECNRLLTDKEMDIREGAGDALACLAATGSGPPFP